MRWRTVNEFVKLARNNHQLSLDVKVFQQHGFVLLSNVTSRGGQTFKLGKRVLFHEISSYRNLPALTDSLCEMMRKEIDWKLKIKR